MTQYQDNTPRTDPQAKDTGNKQSHDRELAQLRQQIRHQQETITGLDRDLKKLRNELRLAVNTFNLTRNG